MIDGKRCVGVRCDGVLVLRCDGVIHVMVLLLCCDVMLDRC